MTTPRSAPPPPAPLLPHVPSPAAPSRAFTLIELLVVIAIISILVGILLPALGGVRAEGKALKCATNLRSVAQGVATYTVDYRWFPPSYVYGEEATGSSWRINQQTEEHPEPADGYIHWSWSFFSSASGMPEDAFRCPQVLNGGAPASNPGPYADAWEPGQRDDTGNTTPTSMPHDRQAKRMAYTGNAAIFPRNKFNIAGERRNQLVSPAGIDGSTSGASGTILATEFLEMDNWQSLATADNEIKSHRPVNPFMGLSAGNDPYGETVGGSFARFRYPEESEILESSELTPGMIDEDRHGHSILNAVGRHHPGGKDAAYGGTANFAYVDGHVERTTVLETVRKRRWGDRFYSITGDNRVRHEIR